MNDIRPGVLRFRALVCTVCFDTFEMAVRAVLGQQITVMAAVTLASRLAEALWRPVQTGVEGLTS